MVTNHHKDAFESMHTTLASGDTYNGGCKHHPRLLFFSRTISFLLPVRAGKTLSVEG